MKECNECGDLGAANTDPCTLEKVKWGARENFTHNMGQQRVWVGWVVTSQENMFHWKWGGESVKGVWQKHFIQLELCNCFEVSEKGLGEKQIKIKANTKVMRNQRSKSWFLTKRLIGNVGSGE